MIKRWFKCCLWEDGNQNTKDASTENISGEESRIAAKAANTILGKGVSGGHTICRRLFFHVQSPSKYSICHHNMNELCYFDHCLNWICIISNVITISTSTLFTLSWMHMIVEISWIVQKIESWIEKRTFQLSGDNLKNPVRSWVASQSHCSQRSYGRAGSQLLVLEVTISSRSMSYRPYGLVFFFQSWDWSDLLIE